MIFANCIPVKGICRSIIVDTQRNIFKFIPNDLFDLIPQFGSCKILEIYKKYGAENFDILEEYIEFLLIQEFAFLTNSPSSFPQIDTTWESPRQFTNAIIDINATSCYDINKVIEQLDDLGIEALQIRIFDEISFSFLKIISDATYLKTNRLRSVQFVLKFGPYTIEKKFIDLVNDNLLVSEVIIHSCSFSKVQHSELGFHIFYTEEEISDASKCGCIKPSYFTTNLNHLNEARNYNTCLNKKISIDVNGLIKNCPSMLTNYGKVDNDFENFNTISENEEFKKVWAIKKDDINICKVCEFRLICSDCRAYVEHTFDKPMKCNYNPYTSKWEN